MPLELPTTWHPIFVHFAIALVVSSVGFDLFARWRGREEWHRVGRLNLLWGVVGLAVAAATGWFEHSRPHAHLVESPNLDTIVEVHEILGYALLAFFAVLLLWRLRLGDRPPAAFIALGVAGVLAIAVQGHLGGVMVYRYGTGIRATPRAEQAIEAEAAPHDHEDGHTH